MKRKLAVVGIGPRGLSALENLLALLGSGNDDKMIHFILFEVTGNFGNGQVYDTNQVETNWINISERILCLDMRPAIRFGAIQLPSFPSYHEWSDSMPLAETTPDTFPPRAKVGAYLEERFKSIADPLVEAGVISLRKERVVDVAIDGDNMIAIRTNLNTYEQIDEVLLTIGHQDTKRSAQIEEWKEFFSDSDDVSLFEDPYPLEHILNSRKLTGKSTIGLRGFGLAMIDVVRGVATRFGEFQILDQATRKCSFNPTVEISNLFVPFSLDGLPPSPKPLNAQLDKWYKPTDKQISDFEFTIGNRNVQKNADSTQFLISAIASIVAKVYAKLPHTFSGEHYTNEAMDQMVQEWLKDETYEHPMIISRNRSAEESMEDFVGMATGVAPVSLDFCVGQVWRHCQPSIYKALSFNECAIDVFKEVIKLDERLKRYSYGPPVESIQQMLALLSAGVMTLEWVNNPEIDLSSKGWKLKSEEGIMIADMMINTVLDPPEIASVISPLIKNMRSKDLLQVVHNDFGAVTNESGYLMVGDDDGSLPIALLGRLAKGTIIGVDAILECFGSRPGMWAAEAADNYFKWLDRKI